MNIFKYHIRNKAREDFIICGHRGDPVNYPENTLPALNAAIADGANALEVDLCITADGVVILWHDWDPDTMEARLRYNGVEPDTGFTPYMTQNYMWWKINEITHQEVIDNYGYKKKGAVVPVAKGDIIPNLGSFLDFVKQNQGQLKYIFLDIKCPEGKFGLGRKMLDQIAEQIKGLKPIFIVESFYSNFLNFAAQFDNLDQLRYGLDVAVPPGFIFNPEKYSVAIHAIVLNGRGNVAVPMRPTALTWKGWMTYKKIIKYDLNFLKKIKSKMKIICATINEEDEMKYLIKAGVAGIQTNYTKTLVKVVKGLT